MNFSFLLSESFVVLLARHLLERIRQQPEMAARMLVLLPSRRACRNLREVILKESGGKPMLLPRLMPIGDIGDEADLSAFFVEEEDAPPVISSKKRIALLMELICRAEPTTAAKAYKLAVALADFLDEATINQLDLGKLEDLLPKGGELAAHWQKTLDVLTLITRHLPRIMEEEGLRDCTQARNERLLKLAKHWHKNPPDFPVIAAGSTGSMPATAALLAVIGNMPEGEVILPGLDAGMDDNAWDVMDATHPQYVLKQLLKTFGTSRKNITLLGEAGKDNATLRAMFAPAPLTAKWSGLKLDANRDTEHIRLLEAATQLDEARMIALTLRKALDTPGKTAALITPDRGLARKVAAQLARYGITIDDSAGMPLSMTPAGIFLRLIADVVESEFAPAALLALLRHPLSAVGTSPPRTREFSRLLEKKLLRGIRHESGISSLVKDAKQKNMPEEFCQWLTRIDTVLRPLELLWLQNRPCTLDELMTQHVGAAEMLASSDEQPGSELLWQHESGNQLAELLGGWRQESSTFGTFLPHEYPALLENFMAAATYRPRYTLHPRLQILSPIEARLSHHDMVILGELNEGVWPSSPAEDPWMSMPMREAFGLPPAGFSLGQSAHDLWMLLHAKEVVLTRAKKITDKPTIASRWWVRLATLLDGHDKALFATLNHSATYEAMIRTQDAAIAHASATQPAPTPPKDMRPMRFSVSNIDRFSEDPYRYYAQYILGLRELDALDMEPDNREFGERVHKLIERFVTKFPDSFPEHAYQEFLLIAEVELQDVLARPAVKNLWWPRIELIAAQFLEEERVLRQQTFTSHCEIGSEYRFTVNDETLTLAARADRLDVLTDYARIIDYKTGDAPKTKQVKEGGALQLPLTAIAIAKGSQAALLNGQKITELAYWLVKGNEKKSGLDVIETSDELFALAEQKLHEVAGLIRNENSAFPAATIDSKRKKYDAFAHLSRIKEWGNN